MFFYIYMMFYVMNFVKIFQLFVWFKRLIFHNSINALKCRSKARREESWEIVRVWQVCAKIPVAWNSEKSVETQNSKLRHEKKKYIEVTALSSFRSINHHLSFLKFSPQLRNRFHTLALLCSISQSLVYPIRVSARTRGPLCTTSFVLCHQRIALQRDTIQNLDPCECDSDCFLWNPRP